MASAQTSAQQGYATPGGIVETQIENGPPEENPNTETRVTVAGQTESVTQTEDSGSLPFTGLDIGLIVAAGGILLALGLGMRRMGRATVA